MARTNRPELDELPEQKRNAILEGADAISTMRDFARRSFDMWMTIARGLAVLREVADQRTSRTAFKHLCKDHGYGTLNEATRSRLLLMAKHETAVRIWREAELTERQREHWNSPTSICNRCPTLRSAIGEASKNKPPPARKSNKPLVLERTLDTLLDCLQEMDADNRLAVLERVLSPFGYAAMAKAAEPAPADRIPGAPFMWKHAGRFDDRDSFKAKAGRGRYEIVATTSGKSRHWVVRHFIGSKQRTVSLQVKSIDDGQALAKHDWATGNADEATKRATQPIAFRI